MTDWEWREVCVEQCWLDIDLHILDSMRKAYDLGWKEGYVIFSRDTRDLLESMKNDPQKT